MDDDGEATVHKWLTAPEPDDPAKARWPWQLSPAAWRYVGRRCWSEFWARHILDNAGNLAYMSVQSLFPAVLAILAALTLVGQGPAAIDWILQFLEYAAPDTVVDLVREPLRNLSNIAGVGWVLSIAALAALWGASGYVAAFGRSSNRIHGVVEGRPPWQVIPYNVLVTLLMLLFGALVLLTVVVSASVWDLVLSYIGLSLEPLTVVRQYRWGLLAMACFVVVLTLYRATPNVRQPRLRWSMLGALVAMVMTVLAILGFSAWVAAFPTMPATYGIVGSFIILLLGLWLMNVALLVGVLINAEVERVRLLEAGFPSEVDLLVRPRNTRMIQARVDEEEMLARKGAALRAQAARRRPEGAPEPSADQETGHSQPSSRPRKSSPGSPS